jgi:hypothetical protein
MSHHASRKPASYKAGWRMCKKCGESWNIGGFVMALSGGVFLTGCSRCGKCSKCCRCKERP